MNRINRALAAADDALRAGLLAWRAPAWLLGALTLRTGSVLAPLLAHMAYNATLALLASCAPGTLMTGLSPLSCLLRLTGCGGFAYALRLAFAAKGTRMAPDGALRVDMQALLSMLAAVLAVVAAQLIAEVLS